MQPRGRTDRLARRLYEVRPRGDRASAQLASLSMLSLRVRTPRVAALPLDALGQERIPRSRGLRIGDRGAAGLTAGAPCSALKRRRAARLSRPQRATATPPHRTAWPATPAWPAHCAARTA